MKSIRSILLCGATLASSLYFTRAQSTDLSPQFSAEDTATMIQAIELATPTPVSSLPKSGTFWSAQHAPGTGEPWPPLPSNALQLDAWNLGDGVYLLNDTNINYDEIDAASAPVSSFSPMARMSMRASSLTTTYAYGNPVYLTNMVASFALDGNITANFSVAGGTNFVPYDILTATNIAAPISSWTWLGIGYTSNNYTFYEQPSSLGFYILAKPSKTMIVPWGDDDYGQCDLWTGITNAVQVTGGIEFSLALFNDGTVTGWGYDGATSAELVPTNLTGVAMIASGWQHNVALLTNGTVTAWGDDFWGEINVPTGLTNVTVISAQALHTLALEGNGTVVAWGYGSDGETNVPAGLTNVTAMAAGGEHNLAVSNGIVVAWGDNASGQCNVPMGLSNVWDVAAGWNHSVALKTDGTVVCWGDNSDGESTVPVGLSHVVAIAAGGDYETGSAYTLALKNDGTVTAWGDSDVTNTIDGLTDVIAIGGGTDHALAIRTGPPTPVITREPTNQYQATNGTVYFNVKGAGLYGVTYQWQTNGVNLTGATNATLMLTNVQSAQMASYDAIVTDNGGWGSLTSSVANLYLVTTPVINSETLPTNQVLLAQTSVTLNVSASALGQFNGFPLSYHWQLDGTNISGATSTNYTFTATVSGTYSLVVSNAAGNTTMSWQVMVLAPGNVWGWGDNSDGESTAPNNITNIAALAAGEYHSVAAEDNGTVIQWGYDWGNIPADLTNGTAKAIAVSAGYEHSIALRSDGTVETWGNGYADYVPTNLTGVKAVSAGWDDNVALLTNGTVTAWGLDGDIFGWGDLTDVAGLTNITAISANGLHALALTTHGTVLAWGDDREGESDVPAGLSNVVAVAAGEQHSLALLSNGTVVAWGFNNAGQCSVPLGLSNVMAIAAGAEHSVALLNNGTVISWGDNTYGQTSAQTLNQIKLLAAGGDHTLAGIFSPTVMYPIDVTKDLLLIYNTNSPDSTTVLNYYLAHRPMVGNANVLGIGCTNAETISPDYYTNIVVPQVQAWLSNNPTRHPQYVILFYDVPSRVNTNAAAGIPFEPNWPSVQYQLSTSCAAGWNPFISSINFNSTNDCIGYINKLAYIGTNYSPGKLIISASAGGYGNTNYYFDDTRNVYPSTNDDIAGFAQSGLLAFNPMASITYSNALVDTGLATHITNGVNVAGYLTWGQHSSLGGDYPIDGEVQWSGNSSWWIIRTVESFNGQRGAFGQGNFLKWFTSTSFGGSNYQDTPVGGVSYTDEPGAFATIDGTYFGLWSIGKNLAICAWNSNATPYFQVVGDPFVAR